MIDIYSVEFYVSIFVVAALIVGLMALPQGRGPVVTSFATGALSVEGAGEPPSVTFSGRADGAVVVTRRGLPPGLATGASTVALAINRKGFDLEIEERITPGASLPSEEQAHTATFLLPGLAQGERYHVRYNSDATSQFVALTFRNRPGLEIARQFPNI